MQNQRVKNEILKVLDMFRYQVENDECPYEEMESLTKLLAEELNAWVTARDLSRIYGRSESSVRMVISRSPAAGKDKPKRKVMYRFGWFSKHLPSQWSD